MNTIKTILLFAILTLAVPAITFAANGQPFQALQNQIDQLSIQLQNIQLTPRPAGPAGPGTKTTVLTFMGGNDAYHSPPEWTQYTSITPESCSFAKIYDNSALYVIWNDTLVGQSLVAGIGYCHWDVRIDNFESYPINSVIWPTFTTADVSYPISVTTVHTGLASGTHTVSLWLKTVNAGCYNNAGGFRRSITILELP